VESVGDRVRIVVDATPPIIAEVTANAATDVGLTEQQPVWIAVKATEIEVYPA
jgi:molybdopterin-binding protein